MSPDDALSKAKEGLGIVGELVKIAGDSPDTREAASNLARSALTITKTINNALLPLAAVNFAFDKARAYFSERFQRDLSEKAAAIPPQNVVEPKASVAGPTLQGLAFSHEEPNLKDMYLSLLATAMDSRVAGSAHPAFVEIIRQLDAEEAYHIKGILQSRTSLPIVQIRQVSSADGEYEVLANHVMDLRKTDDMTTPAENDLLPAMVDNWIRTGLVHVTYDARLTGEGRYAWAEERPEYLRLRDQHQKDAWQVQVQKGYIERTSFGRQFASAAGLL